jgi:hypothetical protein
VQHLVTALSGCTSLSYLGFSSNYVTTEGEQHLATLASTCVTPPTTNLAANRAGEDIIALKRTMPGITIRMKYP